MTFSNFCLVKHWEARASTHALSKFYHVNHFYFSDKEHSTNHSKFTHISDIHAWPKVPLFRTGKKEIGGGNIQRNAGGSRNYTDIIQKSMAVITLSFWEGGSEVKKKSNGLAVQPS